MTASSILSVAFIGTVCVTAGFGQIFSALGLITNNSTLLSWSATVTTNKWWEFLVATACIGVITLILSGGWKWVLPFQNYGFAITTGGLAIIGILLLVKSHSDFVSSFNSFAAGITNKPDTYNDLIAAAHQQGIQTSTPFSLANTWP